MRHGCATRKGGIPSDTGFRTVLRGFRRVQIRKPLLNHEFSSFLTATAFSMDFLQPFVRFAPNHATPSAEVSSEY